MYTRGNVRELFITRIDGLSAVLLSNNKLAPSSITMRGSNHENGICLFHKGPPLKPLSQIPPTGRPTQVLAVRQRALAKFDSIGLFIQILRGLRFFTEFIGQIGIFRLINLQEFSKALSAWCKRSHPNFVDKLF